MGTDRVALPESIPAPSRAGAVVQPFREDKRLRFVIIGGANAAAAFVCFVAYQSLIGERLGYLWSVLAAHLTTVLVGFVSHRRLTFQVSGHLMADLWRFEAVHLSNLALNGIFLAGFVEALHLPVIPAQALLVVISATYSWFGHSRFSFRRTNRVGHD